MKKSLRLFVAMMIPSEVQRELHRIQRILQDSDLFKGTYPVPETSHITLQFIGLVEEQHIDPITQALQSIQFPPFEITFNSVDYFEHQGSPSVVYLNTTSEDLFRLAQTIRNALQSWLTKNDREFVGHLTVMRIKKIHDQEKVRELIDTISVTPLSYTVDSFSLMQSQLSSGGPVYKELTHFPLTATR
jgi:RNA 2',3'-cyclic 3'-phosphodiesterase